MQDTSNDAADLIKLRLCMTCAVTDDPNQFLPDSYFRVYGVNEAIKSRRRGAKIRLSHQASRNIWLAYDLDSHEEAIYHDAELTPITLPDPASADHPRLLIYENEVAVLRTVLGRRWSVSAVGVTIAVYGDCTVDENLGVSRLAGITTALDRMAKLGLLRVVDGDPRHYMANLAPALAALRATTGHDHCARGHIVAVAGAICSACAARGSRPGPAGPAPAPVPQVLDLHWATDDDRRIVLVLHGMTLPARVYEIAHCMAGGDPADVDRASRHDGLTRNVGKRLALLAAADVVQRLPSGRYVLKPATRHHVDNVLKQARGQERRATPTAPAGRPGRVVELD